MLIVQKIRLKKATHFYSSKGQREHEANKTDIVNISVLAASPPFPQNLNRNASLPHQVWAKLTAKKSTSLTQILMAKEKKFPCLIAPVSKKTTRYEIKHLMLQ